MQKTDEIKEQMLSVLSVHEEAVLQVVDRYNAMGVDVKKYDSTVLFKTLRGFEVCFYTYKRKVQEIIELPDEELRTNITENLNYCSFLEPHRVMCYMLTRAFNGTTINNINYYSSLLEFESQLKKYIRRRVSEFKNNKSGRLGSNHLRLIQLTKVS